MNEGHKIRSLVLNRVAKCTVFVLNRFRLLGLKAFAAHLYPNFP